MIIVYKLYKMALRAAGKNVLMLGTCVPCLKKNASKIRVRRLDLDKNLMMYFTKDHYFFAHDPEKVCKSGDVVLVQELPQKLTTLITHKVMEVVYPLGDITDPVTGEKVVVGQYRSEVEKNRNLFVKRKTAFNYEKAPPRGWQEDKKDFTHKESYIKYHEFEDKDQPYALK